MSSPPQERSRCRPFVMSSSSLTKMGASMQVADKESGPGRRRATFILTFSRLCHRRFDLDLRRERNLCDLRRTTLRAYLCVSCYCDIWGPTRGFRLLAIRRRCHLGFTCGPATGWAMGWAAAYTRAVLSPLSLYEDHRFIETHLRNNSKLASALSVSDGDVG